MSDDVMDFLGESGNSYPGFKFLNLKDGIKGRIVEKPRTAKVPDMNNPGEKVTKLVIAIEATAVKGVYGHKISETETEDRPAQVGETYSVWVKGRSLLASAINAAVKAANADGLKEGDVIAIQFTGTKKGKFPQPAKVYEAKLEPAKPTVSVGSLLGDDEPAESLL